MREARLIETRMVALDDIDATARLRPVSNAAVAALVASITEVGVIKDPIDVRRVRHQDNRLVLMAGGHRMAAARQLGWTEIRADIWDCADDWAQLIEIDDNLAHGELNPLDKAVFLATRKRIYEELHPETRQGVKGALMRHNPATDPKSVAGFAESIAETMGITDHQVRRIIQAGGLLSPALTEKLRAAPRAVTLADLMQIVKADGIGERDWIVEALSEGRAKNAAAARRDWKYIENGALREPANSFDREWNNLLGAWGAAGKRARKMFLNSAFKDVSRLLAEVREERRTDERDTGGAA